MSCSVSTPGNPASAVVGSSGAAPSRLALVTASTRSFAGPCSFDDLPVTLATATGFVRDQIVHGRTRAAYGTCAMSRLPPAT